MTPSPSTSLPGALRRLWELLRPRRRQVIGLSALLAFSASLGQFTPQFVRVVIDELIPRGELRLFAWMAAGLVLFYIFYAAVDYIAMYLSFAFTQAVISDVRMRTYGRLLSLPLTRFTAERSGSLVARVVSDVNALEQMIQAGASRIMGHLFSILVVLAVLFAMNWQLALLSLVSLAVMGWVTVHYQTPLRVLARRIRQQVGEMTGTATEAVSNIAVVKSFANEPYEFGRMKRDNDQYVDFNLDRRKQVGMMQALISLSSELGVVTLLLVGGWLIVRGTLTTGELSAFVLYLYNLIGPVRYVLNYNNALQAGMAALERVDELLQDTPEGEGELEQIPSSSIDLRKVTFRYPGSEQLALDGLSFSVESGKTAALVGPSGAGKSTVIKLLSRLYDPDLGTLQLGGQNIRDYRLSTLRRAVSVVPQDPTLFSGSVKDNIRYAKPEASDDEVEEAARLANAHVFIRELPAGYDTEIGERGVKLSGGQKQRVAIARAILKEASVLVLDEATSSLDSESEAVIQDALEGLFARRHEVTTVIIAHRLSTVQKADTIFVLDRGRVVEAGRHPELIRQGGLYRTLYELQFDETPHTSSALQSR